MEKSEVCTEYMGALTKDLGLLGEPCTYRLSKHRVGLLDDELTKVNSLKSIGIMFLRIKHFTFHRSNKIFLLFFFTPFYNMRTNMLSMKLTVGDFKTNKRKYFYTQCIIRP